MSKHVHVEFSQSGLMKSTVAAKRYCVIDQRVCFPATLWQTRHGSLEGRTAGNLNSARKWGESVARAASPDQAGLERTQRKEMVGGTGLEPVTPAM